MAGSGRNIEEKQTTPLTMSAFTRSETNFGVTVWSEFKIGNIAYNQTNFTQKFVNL